MFSLRNLLVLAAVLAVGMAVLAVNRSTATTLLSPNTSLAGGSSGAMAVDCDAAQPGIQSDCTYALGDSFSVQVHVTQPPADGYFAFQTLTQWDSGVVNYLPSVAPADEGLWSGCTIAARAPEPPSGNPPQLFGCVPLPSLTVGSTFTGAIAEFEFQCKAAPNNTSPPAGLDPDQTSIELLPGSPVGSYFNDVDINVVQATLSSAIVTCAEQPPTLDGAMAVDCDASQSGVQSACQYSPGTTFSIQVHATQPPADGYGAFQLNFAWDRGVINYQPTVAPADEGLWSGCTIAARSPEPPTGDPPQLFGCVPLPQLTVGSTFTGAVAEFEFQCKPAPNSLSPPAGLNADQSKIELLPGAPTGTYYNDVAINVVQPVLSSATVTCAEAPFPPWDVDENGIVTISDIQIVVARFGCETGDPCYDE